MPLLPKPAQPAARPSADEVESLFPTPLMRSPGLLPAGLVERLVAEITSTHLSRNDRSDHLSHTAMVQPRANTLYGELAQLAGPKLVAFGELLFGDKLRWGIKEMWTNVLEPGGHQGLHAHANSFVSGIAYLTPSHPGSNTVFVRNGGGGEFNFRHNTPSVQPGPFNAGKWVLPAAEPGDLVLFPSYVLHEVPRNQGKQRITLAFNAIPDRLDSFGYAVSFGG